MKPTPARIDDPVARGFARGWRVIDASALREPQRIECDVAIVGSGAGGGITAELLAKAGLAVVLIEEGPLASSKDFRMREADAYSQLYWDSAARKTRDKAINILQGRAVGGSTTVNWTSSFRTPPATLDFWRSRFGLSEFSEPALAPWFAQAEARLDIRPWTVAPNENNDLLRRGAAKLGIATGVIRRNVTGCANLGYCGLGCPTDAKQSMLVTTIPAALERGARLYTRLRALRFEFDGARIARLVCAALRPDGVTESSVTLAVHARHFVAAGGAINTPGLLLRSSAPDPYRLLGRRTFLHPTVISAALLPQRVDGFAGAPQTVYSDHFLEVDRIDGPLGFMLEAAPLHPVLYATTLHGFGTAHAALMKQFAHAHALIALLRDGFHPQSRGGTVELAADGRAILDYPLDATIWDGVRRAFVAMAEIQFAAGARIVYPVHELADGYTRPAAARAAIERLPLKPLITRVVSAHVMGGCGMAASERQGVVDGRGRHHQVENLSVHDGSIFPTSLGANPQLSIYGIVARMAAALAAELTGRPAPMLA